jgi:hypothetical protein
MSQEFISRRERRAHEAEQANIQSPSLAAPDNVALGNLDALLLLAQQMAASKMPINAVTDTSLAQPLAQSLAQPLAQPVARVPDEVPPTPSRRELRLQESARNSDLLISAPAPVENISEPMFRTSSGFTIDTVTNSIVLPVTPDALNSPLISDSGVTLKTGSIELPNLNAGTGSITIPVAAQIADEALSNEASTSFVSDIAPVAAKNLLSKSRNLELDSVRAKGAQGQMFYALTATMLMLTVGGLLLVAWMYGVIK